MSQGQWVNAANVKPVAETGAQRKSAAPQFIQASESTSLKDTWTRLSEPRYQNAAPAFTPVETNFIFGVGIEKATIPHVSHSLNDRMKPIADFNRSRLNLVPRDDAELVSRCNCKQGESSYHGGRVVDDPPYGDLKGPLGSFYAPHMHRFVASCEGAAGQGVGVIGFHSASAVHKAIIASSHLPKVHGDSVPASSRSDVLRRSNYTK